MNVNKKNKSLLFLVAGLFVLTGTYNAVVINSDSHVSFSNVKSVKRLDEVYGVTIAGRQVAANVDWQKISKPNAKLLKTEVIHTIAQTESIPTSASVELIPAAAVQEELSLSLVEVVNQRMWQTGLTDSQFNGSLSTNSGVIESLNVSLPSGAGLSVSFSEMTGNVFEYDLNGELYSGMMYQVDQGSYMVTLSNGPLEGTRMRFSTRSGAEEQEQTQQYLAENNVEAGIFGNEQAQEIPSEGLVDDLRMQQEATQAQTFNLDQTEAI